MTGQNCEIDIDDCESQPCLHDGVCIDQLGAFKCDCTNTGFTGAVCQLNINECESNPCTNGASCQDKVNTFHKVFSFWFTDIIQTIQQLQSKFNYNTMQ